MDWNMARTFDKESFKTCVYTIAPDYEAPFSIAVWKQAAAAVWETYSVSLDWETVY
jgi:hypothetical protein